MARLGVSKKKKSPRATELSQLKKEVQRLTEQLESRDREQTATSEILRVIASSPTDLQAVLDVVAESAARLCDWQKLMSTSDCAELMKIVYENQKARMGF